MGHPDREEDETDYRQEEETMDFFLFFKWVWTVIERSRSEIIMRSVKELHESNKRAMGSKM